MSKLDADKIRGYLETNFLGKEVVVLEEVDSTQNYLALNLDRFNNGSVVLAEFQTRGRGRLGRVWYAPYGKGVCMSILFKDNFPPDVLSRFTLLASLSLVKFLSTRYRLDFRIRWPNDVVWGKDKLAGTLAELKRNSLIMGIGINLNQNFQELPQSATSIYLITGKEEERNYIVAQYLNGLENDFYNLIKRGYDFLNKLWHSYSSLKDREVIVKTNYKEINAVVSDLAEDGSLILRGDTGYMFKVNLNELLEIRTK